MYTVHFQLVLCSGRQTFSEKCSVRTMEKEERENEFPGRNTNRTLSYFCFVFLPHYPPISFHFWYDMFVTYVSKSVLQAENFCLLSKPVYFIFSFLLLSWLIELATTSSINMKENLSMGDCYKTPII